MLGLRPAAGPWGPGRTLRRSQGRGTFVRRSFCVRLRCFERLSHSARMRRCIIRSARDRIPIFRDALGEWRGAWGACDLCSALVGRIVARQTSHMALRIAPRLLGKGALVPRWVRWGGQPCNGLWGKREPQAGLPYIVQAAFLGIWCRGVLGPFEPSVPIRTWKFEPALVVILLVSIVLQGIVH